MPGNQHTGNSMPVSFEHETVMMVATVTEHGPCAQQIPVQARLCTCVIYCSKQGTATLPRQKMRWGHPSCLYIGSGAYLLCKFE